jgi:hypothetical protein
METLYGALPTKPTQFEVFRSKFNDKRVTP